MKTSKFKMVKYMLQKNNRENIIFQILSKEQKSRYNLQYFYKSLMS